MLTATMWASTERSTALDGFSLEKTTDDAMVNSGNEFVHFPIGCWLNGSHSSSKNVTPEPPVISTVTKITYPADNTRNLRRTKYRRILECKKSKWRVPRSLCKIAVVVVHLRTVEWSGKDLWIHQLDYVPSTWAFLTGADRLPPPERAAVDRCSRWPDVTAKSADSCSFADCTNWPVCPTICVPGRTIRTSTRNRPTAVLLPSCTESSTKTTFWAPQFQLVRPFGRLAHLGLKAKHHSMTAIHSAVRWVEPQTNSPLESILNLCGP